MSAVASAGAGAGAGRLDGRRAIAERNTAAILDAAIALLAGSPEAGVSEIAAAAGVGRATVYRHFPTRDALVVAIRKRATADMLAAIEAAEPGAGDPVEALRRVVTVSLRTADRYRVLAAERKHAPRRNERSLRHVFALIERAQREGALDPALPATWLVGSLRALSGLAIDEVRTGRLSIAEAAELVTRTVVAGARPPESPPPAR